MISNVGGDILALPGIGAKRAQAFEKLGIRSVSDFAEYFPRDYEDRTAFVPISKLQAGVKCCVRATVGTQPVLARLKRSLTLLKCRVFDESGTLEMVFFNKPFVKNQLVVGKEYIFFGALEQKNGFRSMNTPEFEPVGRTELSGRILPIYRKCEGISRKMIMTGVHAALEKRLYFSALPAEIAEENGLCDADFAYSNIHFPGDLAAAQKARQRLIFEEFFVFSCATLRLGKAGLQIPGRRMAPFDPRDFFASLSFKPTAAQERATTDIFSDMCSGKRMNRLLQGDVGSGKTLVAAAAAFLAVKNGGQAVIMAPTELLARQHLATFTAFFAPFGMSCGLLVSSQSKKEREMVKAGAESGAIDIICGTHALIEGDVSFSAATLFVVDEQHRFGVLQRAALNCKNQDAHLLVMSATPIPRTLTLIMYGDLDISVLDELPPGRIPVETYVIGEDKRQRMYSFIEKQVAAGFQAFIVCPLIDDAEGLDDRKAAAAYADELGQELPNIRIGLMHGRLKAAEKQEVMSRFVAGEIDVLVSTTVIEVGVDVPNANLMIVEDASSFGLSQLHQIRGRVGRGGAQAYCILMRGDCGDAGKQRLRALASTTDGFKIAEEDLRLRGPGDFFGREQHGLPQFKIADLATDMQVLQRAKDAAAKFMSQDGALESNKLLFMKTEKMLALSRDTMLN